MVDEVSAGLNPARYVAGLAQAATKAGAAIFENTQSGEDRARRRGKGCQRWRITTSRGALWAREVFVGTSGYTGAATPALRKKIIPIGSYIITTEVLPEALARELSPRNRMIYDSKNYLYYYRLTPDNRMLFGGRAAFFPETADSIRKSAEILRRGMIDVYPQLRDVKVEYVWGGTLDFAFDIMPHAGQMDGIYYAVGYAGHGVAMATWQGQQMAEHDRRREAGESVRGDSVSRRAARAVQRQALVPAVCRGLVQVSGLGKLTGESANCSRVEQSDVDKCSFHNVRRASFGGIARSGYCFRIMFCRCRIEREGRGPARLQLCHDLARKA